MFTPGENVVTAKERKIKEGMISRDQSGTPSRLSARTSPSLLPLYASRKVRGSGMDKSLFQNQVAKVCDEIMHHTESNWFLLRFPDLAVEVVIDHEERTRAFNVLTNAEAKGSNGKRHEFNVSIWGTFASIENTRVEHCDPGFKFRGRGFYFVDLNGV